MEFIANDSGNPMTVSERLVQFVLEREGASKGLTIDQLKAVRMSSVQSPVLTHAVVCLCADSPRPGEA